MAAVKGFSSQRLTWLEGIRIFAAVMLLVYHAQLLFTDYAFTPKPLGLAANLRLIEVAGDRFGHNLLAHILSFPGWFGFQFVDVFILISGFSLVLSLKGKPLETGSFLKHRFLRILWPFWTVAWLSYPFLWAIGVATNSYRPDLWYVFAGASFPLMFEYSGELLLKSSGPWWFVPLILSFAVIFPFLWHLLQRWGSRNLLIVSLALTLGYRALAVYKFGGHPTYVVLGTAANWLPFLPFIAKLSTFVLGMVVARAYWAGQGPLFWRTRWVLSFGILFYGFGFVCQFSRLGWVFADLLLPVGLTLCGMAVFQSLEQIRLARSAMLWLGAHSYSYFLIHNFVLDRTITLVVGDSRSLYWLLLPGMIVGTLMLAVVTDHAAPFLQRVVMAALRDLDYVLTIAPKVQIRTWLPQVGDRVRYQGEPGWTVAKVERLLDDKEVYLCQITDGQKTMWLNEDDLEPHHSPSISGSSTSRNGSRYNPS
ncbi:MAG: acyltransferase [Leptolyngbyaceae cyanobacterium SL_5_14]|nr:acyltransferase [Leptolyngbyaceae cyanobacterium SL_5_14]